MTNLSLKTILSILLLLLQSACTESINNKTQSEDWAKSIALTKAKDINPQKNIIEINLQAIEKQIELKPGVFTTMWTYNNVFPGPTIEANVGDTLIVNFTNNLPVETTVHWHGLELPANMDGSMIAQAPVPAFGGTFQYKFTLNRAATYWYHPHIQSNIQVEKGLYGALIVRDPKQDQAFGLPEMETTIILDDILLDENYQIEPALEEKTFVDPITNAVTLLNGREGNNFLINGKLLSIDSDGTDLKTIELQSGVPVRLRLINAANARFFRLSIPGHTIYRIGGDAGLLSTTIKKDPIEIITSTQNKPKNRKINSRDGVPLQFYSNPDPNQGILLVPGERADIVFTPQGNKGDTGAIEWHFFPRGYHGVADDGSGNLVINHNHAPALTAPIRLLNFKIVDDKNKTSYSYSPPVTLVPTAQISTTEETPILPVLFGHSNPDSSGDIKFFASKDKIPFEQLTDVSALNATVGKTYIWEVTNLSQGDHPFHTHGFMFQHLSTEYIDQNAAQTSIIEYPQFIESKDTIRIPARRGLKGQSKTVVRLAVKFDDVNREGSIAAYGKVPITNADNSLHSGGWFVHCHILEHATRGMGTYLNLRY